MKTRGGVKCSQSCKVSLSAKTQISLIKHLSKANGISQMLLNLSLTHLKIKANLWEIYRPQREGKKIMMNLRYSTCSYLRKVIFKMRSTLKKQQKDFSRYKISSLSRQKMANQRIKRSKKSHKSLELFLNANNTATLRW